eukprot:304158_1
MIDSGTITNDLQDNKWSWSYQYSTQVDNNIVMVHPDGAKLSIFDMSTNIFQSYWNSIEIINEKGCLTSSNNFLFLTGGTGELSTTLQILSLSTNQWMKNLPQSNHNRINLACVVHPNTNELFLIGGYNEYMQEPVKSVEHIFVGDLDTSMNRTWQSRYFLTNAPERASSFVYGNDIVIIGGYQRKYFTVNGQKYYYPDYSCNVQVINTLEIYTTSRGYLDFCVYGTATIMVNNVGYAFGGVRENTGSDSATDFWQYANLGSPPTGSPSMEPTSISLKTVNKGHINISFPVMLIFIGCGIVIVCTIIVVLRHAKKSKKKDKRRNNRKREMARYIDVYGNNSNIHTYHKSPRSDDKPVTPKTTIYEIEMENVNDKIQVHALIDFMENDNFENNIALRNRVDEVNKNENYQNENNKMNRESVIATWCKNDIIAWINNIDLKDQWKAFAVSAVENVVCDGTNLIGVKSGKDIATLFDIKNVMLCRRLWKDLKKHKFENNETHNYQNDNDQKENNEMNQKQSVIATWSKNDVIAWVNNINLKDQWKQIALNAVRNSECDGNDLIEVQSGKDVAKVFDIKNPMLCSRLWKDLKKHKYALSA